MRIHYNQTRGFCERLCKEMDKQEINCVELGDRVGVDRKTVYTWTGGYTMPNALILSRLCGVLHVSADYLLHGQSSIPTMMVEKKKQWKKNRWKKHRNTKIVSLCGNPVLMKTGVLHLGSVIA